MSTDPTCYPLIKIGPFTFPCGKLMEVIRQSNRTTPDTCVWKQKIISICQIKWYCLSIGFYFRIQNQHLTSPPIQCQILWISTVPLTWNEKKKSTTHFHARFGIRFHNMQEKKSTGIARFPSAASTFGTWEPCLFNSQGTGLDFLHLAKREVTSNLMS